MPKRRSFNHNSYRIPRINLAIGIATIMILGLGIWLLMTTGRTNNVVQANTLPATISVEGGYDMYKQGAFVLDVRTQEEWDQFHAPNTTLIPLDQLSARINEVPKDRPILVVCRSGNRSDSGRDVLLAAGYHSVTSMDGGLTAWRELGYPIEAP